MFFQRGKSDFHFDFSIGFDSGEAAILQMRAKLMNDLWEHVEFMGITQIEAAERLGIAQSRVSDLMRGK